MKGVRTMEKSKRENTLKNIGRFCKRYRVEVLGKTQWEVANEIGTTAMTISAFELGRNDSAIILAYYINKGIVYLFREELWRDLR